MSDELLGGGSSDFPEPLDVRARRGGGYADACPLGLCDGSGFVIDEATNTATDCGCRPGASRALARVASPVASRAAIVASRSTARR